jgi:hypothetical protein
MFVIFHNATMIGVADFIDDAQRCAERMSGQVDPVAWTPTGDMIDINGASTGYFLKRSRP